MNNFEGMREFFDKRAETYDKHMEDAGISSSQFYARISASVANTKDKIRILDIGCGTGLELEGIFDRAPHAEIVGVDLSGEMLNELRAKYQKYVGQITLIQESYLTLPFGSECYDYVVAVMTLHHLLPDKKRRLYQRIKKALKSRGQYIEGDYIVTPEKEARLLVEYLELSKAGKDVKDGTHHIDIPFSLDTEKRVMAEAGFSRVEVLWQQGEAAVYIACL